HDRHRAGARHRRQMPGDRGDGVGRLDRTLRHVDDEPVAFQLRLHDPRGHVTGQPLDAVGGQHAGDVEADQRVGAVDDDLVHQA
ncbi:hypothetical protein DKP78_22545, partial [Enterococcus faecium]